MFPSLATMKKVLTSFRATEVSERTTMANDEVEAEEPQAIPRKGKGKKERNWRDEEIDLLIVINWTKNEVVYCQIDAERGQKNII